jgi:hypothetical protein
MSGHSYRLKLLTGAAAACVALSSISPSFAQGTTLQGSWLSGPDGQGPSTIVGRVEAPRVNAKIVSSTNLLVSGWAADTTATGWAGIDGVEVWSGAKDKKESAKLGSGTVGLTRADVGDALGSTFTASGFTAIVPSSALQPLSGAVSLYVYLHTPGKGTWYRTVGINVSSAAGVNIATGAALDFPTDPIVVIARPQDGMNITQKQKNNKFSFNGIALDRNAITDPNIQLSGPGCSGCAGSTGAMATSARGAGISSITAYIDTPPAKGDQSIFGNFGTACGAACLYSNILVSNAGFINTPGRKAPSIISRNYGSQFDFSGWSISINPATLSPGPHTLYVTATSSVTGALNAANQFVGKTSTASVTFNILDLSHQKIQP